MKLFVIFFFMVIGYACVDLQRVEIGEDDLKSNKNARKVDTLAANETTSEDQYIRAEDVPAPALSVDKSSKETEASEKPSSAVMPMTVTSEVKKSGQRAYLGTRVIDLWSLLKHSHRHISANRYSMEIKRSFPRTSAAIRNTEKDIAIKTRTKRNAEYEAKRKERQNKGWGSYRTMEIFKLFGQPGFHPQCDVAVAKERALLNSLATTGTASTEVLNEYKADKEKERKMAYHIAHGGGKLFSSSDYVDAYIRLIEDPIEEYIYDSFGIRRDYMAFFDTPSPALDKYMAMKRKEFDTAKSYLKGSEESDIYDGQQGNEFEGGAIENSAKPDFECPKKKRESGSLASQMHAQVFVIFLCMVIGIFIVHLQELEIGEDDLKAYENANEAKRSFPRAGRIKSAVKRLGCTILY